MNYYNELFKLKTPEFRSFVKENAESTDFISEVVQEKEVFVPLLLKHKAFPNSIESKICEKNEGILFLIEKFIEFGYIPSTGFIDKICNQNDDLVLRFLKTFPSYPVNVSGVIKLINNGLINSAVHLVSEKKELQKDELLYALIRLGVINQNISKIAIGSKMLIAKLAAEFSKAGEERYPYTGKNDRGKWKDICPEVMGEIVLHLGPDLELSALSGLKISAEVLSKVFNSSIEKTRKEEEANRYFRYYGRMCNLVWTQEIEKIDEEILSVAQVRVTEPPQGSKFRKNWIINYPNDASDEEIIELSNISDVVLTTTPSHGRKKELPLISSIISRGRRVLDAFGVKRIMENASPSCIEGVLNYLVPNCAANDESKEYILYLLENCPPKLKSSFRKKLPSSIIPEDFNRRKRSFFDEAITALHGGKVEEFREILSGKYNINRFVEDATQPSKQSKAFGRRLGGSVVAKLKKEELITLCNSRFQFYIYELKELENSNLRLSAEEAIELSRHIGLKYSFELCNEKNKMLTMLPNYDFFELLDEREELFESKEFFTIIINRIRSEKSENTRVSQELTIKLSKVLNREELCSIVDFSHRWGIDEEFLNLRCADGKFFLDEETIIKNYIQIESKQFAHALVKRDLELAKKIFDAYCSGNTGLTVLTGIKQKIKRKSLKEIEELQELLNIGDDKFCELLNSRPLEQIIEQIPDAVGRINKLENSSEIKLTFSNLSITSKELDFICSLNRLKIAAKRITLKEKDYGDRLSFSEKLSFLFNTDNLYIGEIVISGFSESYFDSNPIKDLVKKFNSLSEKFGQNSVTLSENSKEFNLSLIRSGLKASNSSSIIEEIISSLNDFSDLSIESLKFLEESGFIFNRNNVREIILNCRGSENVISWLHGRLGRLDSFYIEKDSFYGPDSKIEEIKKYGIRVLDPIQFFIEETKEKLLSSGKNFEGFSFSQEINSKQKLEIIRFIEDKIDPRFKFLNLASENLIHLELILPYEQMKLTKLDDDGIISLFKFKNLSGNKKTVSSLKDLISLKGQGLTTKARLLSEIVRILNPKIEIQYDDLVEISKDGEVTESSLFLGLSIQTVTLIHEAVENKNAFFLENKDRQHILSYIRSCCGKEANYLRDISDMVTAIQNGTNAISSRILEIDDEENKQRLIEAKDRIEVRLEEVLSMNDCEAIHDRLVPILSFIKSDPLQPLGQDKYKKIEKSSKTEEKLGFNLFFPKTRDDLIYLGDNNGWCVNYHRHYGDNVISKGNILVGLCERDFPSSRENVIALAHFINYGNNSYSLEQLKWSSRKKNGSRNVDATRDFDHELLKSIIIEFLKQERT